MSLRQQLPMQKKLMIWEEEFMVIQLRRLELLMKCLWPKMPQLQEALMRKLRSTKRLLTRCSCVRAM